MTNLNILWSTLWSLLFVLMVGNYLVITSSEVIEKSSDDDHYAIVVDAGSTGSRAFILKFSIDNQTHTKTVLSWKGAKVEPGLSSFSDDSVGLINNIIPIFIDAKKYIPSEYHPTASIYIKGTAGMRLLPLEIQESLWHVLHTGLQSHPDFPFHTDIKNMGTIDGQHEAFYAVISSNYIEGSINAEMVPQEGTTMVGAFDMGGSSTQLIFHKGVSSDGENDSEKDTNTNSSGSTNSVKQHDFWSHSWINYGVEKIRERVWEMLIQNAISSTSTSTTTTSSSNTEDSSVAAVTYVSNPCTFVGHEYIWNESYVLLGTGDSVSCVKLIEKVLWNIEHNKTDVTDDNNNNSDYKVDSIAILQSLDSDGYNDSIDVDINGDLSNNMHSIHERKVAVDVEVINLTDNTTTDENNNDTNNKKSPKYIDGIIHPPLKGRFYGMSVYFYAMDCIRQLGPVDLSQHWPSPRIDDLEEAAHAFCGMNWDYVQASLHDTHPYTKNSQLANRCIEGLYIVTLLEHAFGLNGQEQNITLALDVKGIEVEWTLGFALAEIVPSLWKNKNKKNRSSITRAVDTKSMNEVDKAISNGTSIDSASSQSSLTNRAAPFTPSNSSSSSGSNSKTNIFAPFTNAFNSLFKGITSLIRTILSIFYI